MQGSKLRLRKHEKKKLEAPGTARRPVLRQLRPRTTYGRHFGHARTPHPHDRTSGGNGKDPHGGQEPLASMS